MRTLWDPILFTNLFNIEIHVRHCWPLYYLKETPVQYTLIKIFKFILGYIYILRVKLKFFQMCCLCLVAANIVTYWCLCMLEANIVTYWCLRMVAANIVTYWCLCMVAANIVTYWCLCMVAVDIVNYWFLCMVAANIVTYRSYLIT